MRAFLAGLACYLLASQLQASVDVNVRITSEDSTQVVALPGAVLLFHPLAQPHDIATLPATVTQINRQFEPYITVVAQGSEVSFPNRDATAHHVYSFSSAKSFELPLYKNEYPAPVVFDTPGVVVLGCNIHDWMLAYIYVADTPYFSQLEDAKAAFQELPPGAYRAALWHPDLNTPVSQVVEIKAGNQALELVFQLPESLNIRSQPVAPDQSFDSDDAY